MVTIEMDSGRKYYLEYDAYNISVSVVRTGDNPEAKNFGKDIISTKSFYNSVDAVVNKLLFTELGVAINEGRDELVPEMKKIVSNLKREFEKVTMEEGIGDE